MLILLFENDFKLSWIVGTELAHNDKFNRENINFWKFKLEIRLVFMDLWGIMNDSEEAPPSNIHSKLKKQIQKAFQEGNVHHCAQLGGQSTCIHQELQRTNIGIENPLQHL